MVRITKKYRDVIASTGDVVIIYDVEIFLGRLPMGRSQGLIHWRSGMSNLGGKPAQLLRLSPAFSSALGDDPWRMAEVKNVSVGGILWDKACRCEWYCVQPNVAIHIGKPIAPQIPEALSGVGYAEVLTLTGKPWCLPLRGLLWGRVATREFSLVWIQWSAGSEVVLKRAWCNGCEVPLTTADPSRVVTAAGTLEIGPGEVLRSSFETTGLSRWQRLLAKFFLGTLAMPHETKWLSSARWLPNISATPDLLASTTAVKPQENLPVIHEQVDWGRR